MPAPPAPSVTPAHTPTRQRPRRTVSGVMAGVIRSRTTYSRSAAVFRTCARVPHVNAAALNGGAGARRTYHWKGVSHQFHDLAHRRLTRVALQEDQPRQYCASTPPRSVHSAIRQRMGPTRTHHGHRTRAAPSLATVAPTPPPASHPPPQHTRDEVRRRGHHAPRTPRTVTSRLATTVTASAGHDVVSKCCSAPPAASVVAPPLVSSTSSVRSAGTTSRASTRLRPAGGAPAPTAEAAAAAAAPWFGMPRTNPSTVCATCAAAHRGYAGGTNRAHAGSSRPRGAHRGDRPPPPLRNVFVAPRSQRARRQLLRRLRQAADARHETLQHRVRVPA